MESAEVKGDCHRIPTIEEVNGITRLSLDKVKMKKKAYVLYETYITGGEPKRIKKEHNFYTYCCLSVIISFIFGLSIGVLLMGGNRNPDNSRKVIINNSRVPIARTLNSLKDDTKHFEEEKDRYSKVSFIGSETKYVREVYPKGLTDNMKDILKDNVISKKHTIANVLANTFVPNEKTVLYDDIFWGPEVENSMPQGYGHNTAEIWEKYVDQSEVVKMEVGCGRMQNRLVTFRDGIQACVRYRQNTDQIQGEIFSFYVGRLLNLTNLAPSAVKVIDLKDKLWINVANDIAAAQWNINRAVVLTQYIPSLESATIPEIFKPSSRHLNKFDVMKMTMKENGTIASKQILINKIRSKNVKTVNKEAVNETVEMFNYIEAELNKKTIGLFVELAQWSDLIIFDYLTANLDRIVNNLFNFQWNINIMDGPAHNLAKKMDSGLLLFLDNESGLLHGYRLLKKYNVYHNLMLDNLCVFRKRTVDSLRGLHESSIGSKLSDMFHVKNNAIIRDILPPLPDKNAKILNERIGKVLSQVEKCEQAYR